MAEYIEREALLTFAGNHKSGLIDCNDIARFPAADVAEVVRCRDCIGKANWYKNDYGCTICGLSGMFVVEDRDFCSYGERKDNG